jgi:hypothetical protein
VGSARGDPWQVRTFRNGRTPRETAPLFVNGAVAPGRTTAPFSSVSGRKSRERKLIRDPRELRDISSLKGEDFSAVCHFRKKPSQFYCDACASFQRKLLNLFSSGGRPWANIETTPQCAAAPHKILLGTSALRPTRQSAIRGFGVARPVRFGKRRVLQR